MGTLMEELDRMAEELSALLPENPVLARLLDGTIPRDWYIHGVLVPIYHYTGRSSAWLKRCGERLAQQGRCPHVAVHLAKKSNEERGHHRLAMMDALALGASPDVMGRAPDAAVAAYIVHNDASSMVGSPLGILGTSYILEYIAARSGAKVLEALAARSEIAGIQGAVRFLKGHAHHDVGHLEELCATLAEVSDGRDQEPILASAHVTARLFPLFFRI